MEMIVYKLYSNTAGVVKELFKRIAKAFVYIYGGNISSVNGLAF
jgi:hypothetical protein